MPAALEHLKGFVSDHAGQAGKGASLSVACSAILVRPELIDATIPAIVQLLRNAIEHGIERPMDRLTAGKPLGGMLSIAVAANGENIDFSVRNDGARIDPAKVAEAAIAAGEATQDEVEAMSAETKQVLIFRRGVTTVAKDARSRGFGLKRAAARLKAVKGRMTLVSKPGGGTIFSVVVPTGLNDEIVVPRRTDFEVAEALTIPSAK